MAEFEITRETDTSKGESYKLDQAHTSETPQEPTRGRLTWAIGTQVGRGHERGFARKTNNTGELVALLLALKRTLKRKKGSPTEVIWVDSLYARNLTMGIWLPTKKTNANLVQELRDTWRLVQVKRGRDEVRIEHVRSHTSVPGNELADKLADAGRQLTSHTRDMGVDDARPLMRSIALAANARQRRMGHRPQAMRF